MSNFAGVTFPYQRPTSSDHAIVNRAALTDGFLSGCTLTFAGTGLTMDAGHLILCGRHVRHTAIETWTVDGASSGYARLILAIDTTKTSTLDAFAQVEASVDYADAAEGFPALTQSDINADGVLYQAAACIVSLGSGGITGIVQQLPAASARGGGGLNFKVVGGTAQPADPVENMIWVNTDVEITDVVISNAKPLETGPGLVWIRTGTYSAGWVDVAPESGVRVYPVSCTVYSEDVASGVVSPAQTYRGGRWRPWGAYLFYFGDECAELTGGWRLVGADTAFTPSVTDTSLHLEYYYGTKEGRRRYIHTDVSVDLTFFNDITLNDGWLQEMDPSHQMAAILAVGTTHPLYDPNGWESNLRKRITVTSLSNVSRSLDVSDLTGDYYVFVILEGRKDSDAFVRVTVDITAMALE